MSRFSALAPFFIICLIVLGFSGLSAAQPGPKNGDSWTPAPPAPPPLDQNPLTVEDLVIDKTGDNPVVARDQAIADAPALAFRKLAERNMSPEAAKALAVPANVSSLVQNFEIRNEQMSSTRYVAKFIVRFKDAVRNYIDIADAGPAPGTVEMTMDALHEGSYADEAERPAAPAADAADKTAAGQSAPGDVAWNAEGGSAWHPPATGSPVQGVVLVLPYFENISAQTLLWEDPNPWRRAWQNAALPSGGPAQFIVPLGDIGDIATGPSNAVWSGDYKAVEKLREKYGAESVVLPVANKSGDTITIDIYTFSNGKLRQEGSITPYTGDDAEGEAFNSALADTLRFLQQPPRRPAAPRTVEKISREVSQDAGFGTTVIDGNGAARGPVLKPQIEWRDSYRPQAAPSPAPATPAAPAQTQARRGQISAAAFFPNFKGWVEMQRRLASIGPGVAVDVRSLNANRAQLTVNYDGSFDALRGALAARGIAIAHQGGGEFVLSLAN
jgi:hypothetical protein